MSHRDGQHRSRRGRHCACQPCRAYRRKRPQRDPAPVDPKPAPRPAPPPDDPVPYDPPLVGPMIPPYRGPDNDVAARLIRGMVGDLPTPAQLMRGEPRAAMRERGQRVPATGRTRAPALAEHFSHGPDWVCRRCGRPYPCPAWTRTALDKQLRAALLSGFLRMAQQAVRDLRGRPGGPTPPEIVRRFLWFVPLTDDEARAVALRVR